MVLCSANMLYKGSMVAAQYVEMYLDDARTNSFMKKIWMFSSSDPVRHVIVSAFATGCEKFRG